MKPVHNIGDTAQFKRVVQESDAASFEGVNVHPVMATFSITRDAEWAGRIFVLAMKEEHEEGIGTFVNVEHLSPAFIGEEVVFEAIIDELYKNVVNCSFTAKVGERLVAKGRTGQKIITKEKLDQLFQTLR
ncbi:MAG: hypothetical protein JNL95_15125 [Chitinophagales bacterium]|nr:hypothetical protein [Chitinophagales bacterium]